MEVDGDSVNAGKQSIAFEVKLKEADGVSPFKPLENKTITEEAITEKLDNAALRRLSLILQKQDQAAKEMKRAQDAKRKVQQDVEQKRKKIEEELAADQEAKEQNRLQRIEEMKQKIQNRLAAHAKRLSSLEQTLNNARLQLSERIESELGLAEDRRNKQLEDMLTRIKEHESHVQEIRQNADDASANKELLDRHMEKMEHGLKNREEQLNTLLERLREHNFHVKNVQKNKQNDSPRSDDSPRE